MTTRRIKSMSVKIISDSASDISQEYAEKLGVRIIPLSFSFGSAFTLPGSALKSDHSISFSIKIRKSGGQAEVWRR